MSKKKKKRKKKYWWCSEELSGMLSCVNKLIPLNVFPTRAIYFGMILYLSEHSISASDQNGTHHCCRPSQTEIESIAETRAPQS